LASCLAFTIQPSAKAAEVASGSYWQSLDEALRAKNEQIWYDTAYWNATVQWNEALAANKAAEQTPKTTQPQPKVNSDSGPQSGDRFDRLAQCESGGNPATNTGNGYYGAFQFTLSTWKGVGGTGLPSSHSYSEQKEKAIQLASQSNPGTQWPVCWYR